MTHRDYGHRSPVDKLGIKPDHAVVLVEVAGPLDETLRSAIHDRTGREEATPDEAPDVVLITADVFTDTVSVLREWRQRIRPNGGIWLLTPKRGQPGYVNQTDLIPAGGEAGMVDNKTCSISEETSAMRFVIRRVDRPPS